MVWARDEVPVEREEEENGVGVFRRDSTTSDLVGVLEEEEEEAGFTGMRKRRRRV